jgi:hypothetical protein
VERIAGSFKRGNKEATLKQMIGCCVFFFASLLQFTEPTFMKVIKPTKRRHFSGYLNKLRERDSLSFNGVFRQSQCIQVDQNPSRETYSIL